MQPWTSLKYMECLVSHKAHEIRSMQCKICRKIKAIKAYTFATTCFPLSKQNQILSHLHCPLAPLKPMRVARVAVRSWGCQGEKKGNNTTAPWSKCCRQSSTLQQSRAVIPCVCHGLNLKDIQGSQSTIPLPLILTLDKGPHWYTLDFWCRHGQQCSTG